MAGRGRNKRMAVDHTAAVAVSRLTTRPSGPPIQTHRTNLQGDTVCLTQSYYRGVMSALTILGSHTTAAAATIATC